MDIVEQVSCEQQKHINVSLHVGDSVNVHLRLREAGKERVQVFSGVVLKIQGRKSTKAFTVRKISEEIGVEKTFPLASPALKKVEVLSRAKVRRARLFYLRKRKGRQARLTALKGSADTKTQPAKKPISDHTKPAKKA